MKVGINSYTIDSDREVLVKVNSEFVDIQVPIFARQSISNFEVFTSPGVYWSESWGAWSQRTSEIVFERKKMPKSIILSSYPATNRLNIRSEAREITVELSKGEQEIVSLNMFEDDSNFVKISFDSKSSDIPSSVNQPSTDNRELSFSVMFSN